MDINKTNPKIIKLVTKAAIIEIIKENLYGCSSS